MSPGLAASAPVGTALVALHCAGEHTISELEELFSITRSTVYRALAAALAHAIDDAFARWDRAHLHRFALADGTQIGRPDWESDDDWGQEPPLTDGHRLTLGRLRGDEQFPTRQGRRRHRAQPAVAQHHLREGHTTHVVDHVLRRIAANTCADNYDS